jgi:hypothetical protein
MESGLPSISSTGMSCLKHTVSCEKLCHKVTIFLQLVQSSETYPKHYLRHAIRIHFLYRKFLWIDTAINC